MKTEMATLEQKAKWIGASCRYFDQFGKQHYGLITQVWGYDPDLDQPSSINLVIVSDDEKMTDQYGRQIKHETSVVHEELQAAHGRFFNV